MTIEVNTTEDKNMGPPSDDQVASCLVDENLEAGGDAGTVGLKEKKKSDYWIGLVHIDGDRARMTNLFGEHFRPVSMPTKDFLESRNFIKPAPATPQNTPVTPPVKQKPVAKIKKVVAVGSAKKKRGRPKAIASVDAVAKIMDMSKTMSSRSIARVLTDDGTPIDHSTVTRIINGQRQLL